jgi:hypothetical protein
MALTGSLLAQIKVEESFPRTARPDASTHKSLIEAAFNIKNTIAPLLQCLSSAQNASAPHRTA